jgi:quinol monooxygenase YgiN
MISLVVSGVGAVVAAVGSGVLLARCFREPRADLIAWSLALLGLLISLGSQTLGHLTGFDPAMFRGMEVGGQVIAPLALILGLSEVAAKSTAARFCARLYIPALAIVATVILGLDQLAQVGFSTAWPDPSVFYQVPPNYVLMFGIGPTTALVTLIAVGTVMSRSSQPGWDGLLRPQLMAGVAALALAYPCLAQLVAYLAGIHLPVRSEFGVLCAMAAGLTWAAGVGAGRTRLAALQDRSAGAAASSWDGGDHFGDGDRSRQYGRVDPAAQYGRVDPAAQYGRVNPAADRGLYRDGDDFWPDRPAQNATRSLRGDSDDRGYGRPDDRFGSGDFATGDFATGDFATGDVLASGRGDSNGRSEHDYDYADDRHGLAAGRAGSWADEVSSDRDFRSAAPVRAATQASQEQMFGQIAIYTVLEDRVAEFDQLTEAVVEEVRSREPDTLVFIVHAVPSAPMQRILYEVYRDRAAYHWHTQQSYVRQFEADRRPYVLATNVIELGLQQAKFPSVADLFGEPGYDTSGFERPDFLRDYGRTSGQRSGGGRGELR